MYSRTSSKPTWRYTIVLDKWGVQIGEMEGPSAKNWGSVGDNQGILGFSIKMGIISQNNLKTNQFLQCFHCSPVI